MKYTKNTTVAEIMKTKKGMKAMVKFNIPCLGCPMAAYEVQQLKIGDVAKFYNIDLKGLLKDLNK